MADQVRHPALTLYSFLTGPVEVDETIQEPDEADLLSADVTPKKLQRARLRRAALYTANLIIARCLDDLTPVSTVRRWLRAARNPAHLERIRRWANQRTFRIDPDTLNRITPAGGPLGDAMTALAAYVDAVRRCDPDITAGDWALIGVITGGRLLRPAPSG